MVRAVTTLFIFAALALAVTWPLELRDRPTRRDPLPVRRSFVTRLLVHTSGIALCLIGAGVGAVLISRQAKREYREAAMRNMRSLVEGEEEK